MATDTNLIKEAAHEYIARGFQVIPLHGMTPEDACTCKKGAECNSAGKHPVWKHWPKDQLKDDLVDGYFTNNPLHNLGIKTGPSSGIFVLDIDPGHGGKKTMRTLMKDQPPLPPTLYVTTGSGGYHYYFNLPDFDMRNTASKLGDGVDTRADGGQVVAAPSVSGVGAYEISKDRPIADAPDWLLEKLRPKEKKPKAYQPDTLPHTPLEDIDENEQQRLSGYAMAVGEKEIERLQACTAMAVQAYHEEDEEYHGPPWNQTVFEVACNLIQLANADWNNVSRDMMAETFFTFAPVDEKFGVAEAGECWNSAESTVDDKAAPYPDRPDNIEDYWDSLEVFERKDETPGDEKDSVVVRVPARFEGTPVADGVLDPTYIKRTHSQVNPKYTSRIEPDRLSEGGPATLADVLDAQEGTTGDVTALEEWVDSTLRSSTPSRFWRAVGELALGNDAGVPTIVIRGGGTVLGPLAEALRPTLGEVEETLLFGPKVTTREQGGDRIVFEFGNEPVPDFDPQAVLARGLAELEKPISEVEETEMPEVILNDTRSVARGMALYGRGSTTREEEDEEAL